MNSYGDKYYLGLDLGTSSVGWALTDEYYHIRRAKGKDLWGSRLFDEAETCVDRRSHRSARRRLAREKARIGLLREFFANEIEKKDPNFYLRLDESKYHFEDRVEENKQKYGLFSDDDFTDIDYFKRYPTIFHLRKELIDNTNAPYDVRLVFLALVNMFKHRGNFLNSNLDDSSDAETDMKSAWDEFADSAEMYNFKFDRNIDIKELENILGEKGSSKTKILEKVSEFLSVTKKEKAETALLKLICGCTGKMTDIYNSGDVEIIDEEHKNLSVCFRDSNYDEKSAEVIEYLGEEMYQLIDAAKVVHDIGLFANIMKGKKYLTEARVEDYENHRKDLELLKKVLNKYDKEAYNKMFRVMDPGNYSAYVGSVNSSREKGKIRRTQGEGKGRSIEDLYKTIKNVLKDFPEDDADVQTIKDKVDNECFLPKQLTADNGVIPNQEYVKEMKKILSNAEGYLPFLKEKDEESGLTVSERILMLFSFRIPYYVGPLGQQHVDKEGYNVWAQRKEPGRILPWNFEQKIDTGKTAEKFIERMLRHCTYLNGETTLPKGSLMYERFMVLNEINNIKINGEGIEVKTKQDIYNSEELFGKGKKVTIKKLEKFFINAGIVDKDATDFLSGIDTQGGIKSSLSSYGKFKSIIGDKIDTPEGNEMVENIIFWLTIYGDEKKMIKRQIEENYPDMFTEAEIKRILGYKYDGWGNLSKEFLNLEGRSKTDDIPMTIIGAMWATNNNLMELLSEEFTFKETLDEKTKVAERPLSEWIPEDLEGLYLSAPVKRMVWQTIKIMNELVQVTGRTPDRIFVEMPREEGEKGKRTEKRKDKLSGLYKDFYKSIKKDSYDYGHITEMKNRLETFSDAEMRSKKLYLYYLQKGRCMYSGEIIDLDTLQNDNTAYDIDHIYPRHFVKDDSIENNLVLVKKQINNHKQDNYPIESDIRNNRYAFWKGLLDQKFITAEKFSRLIRKEEFSDEEKAAFVSRQLVETRQGTKAITQIIKQAFPDSEIVFSKAGVVSDFRKRYEFNKSRLVNDLHHAKDAYLNIVVGNTYFVKFTRSPLIFMKEAAKASDNSHKYHMDRIFVYDVVRNGEVAWIGTGEKGENKHSETFATVKRTMERNTPLITKRAYIAHGGITAKDTVWGKEKAAGGKGYIPMSGSDPRLYDIGKYGGRTDINNMCYCLVSYELKGKEILSLEALPNYLGNIEEISEEKIIEYLQKSLEKENLKKSVSNLIVRKKSVKYNSIIKLDGFYYYIGGKTGNSICLKNAQQLMMSSDVESYVKKIEKAKDIDNYDEEKDGKVIITKEKNLKLYDFLIQKLQTCYKDKRNSIKDIVVNGKEKFVELEIKDQIYTLLQIITWFSPNIPTVDLLQIGGSKNSGVCRANKKISEYKEVVIISISPTGLFVSEYKI